MKNPPIKIAGVCAKPSEWQQSDTTKSFYPPQADKPGKQIMENELARLLFADNIVLCYV
jgi:hypothetical protein